MYLVVGSTGLVGGEVARRLGEQGRDVRALVRGDLGNAKAAALRDAGIKVAAGDLRDPSTLEPACRGVQTLVCTATAMPAAGGDALQKVDHEGVLALIGAAERAGVRHFVYVSFSGGITTDSPLARAKRACEARLAQSAMRTTVLRPSFFMEVWLGPHLGFDAVNAKARVFGEGNRGVSYVSAHDVASIAAAAATRDGPAHAVLEVGGPRPVSLLDVVAIHERLLGRRFTLEFVPTSVLEAQHRSADPLQQTFAALMLACAAGDPIHDARETARRYGVELRSVEDFARF
jgi:NADH dehydrogenase